MCLNKYTNFGEYEVKIHLLDSDDWPNISIKDNIENVISDAHSDASKIITKVSKNVNYIVQPSNKYDVIEETGELGVSYNSELIKISFDYSLPYGEAQLLQKIRATVFHEFNHVARYYATKYDGSLLNYAITEGLATVFERDYSNASRKTLWGEYESDKVMKMWLLEILNLKDGEYIINDYAFDHPDGRRWILYKIGTWIVDAAIRNSNLTIDKLTRDTAENIFKISQV